MRRKQTGRQANPFRYVHVHRRKIGLSYRLLAALAVFSIVTGFGQAALLIVVVRAMTALTTDTALISGTIGPLSATDLTTGELIAIGFGLVGLVLVAELATAFTAGRLLSRSVQSTRRKMLALYSAASYEEQTARPRGDTQEVLVAQPNRAAGVTGALGAFVIAMVNFTVLVASAFVVSPVAALAVFAGMALVIAALRPLIRLTRRLAREGVQAARRLGAAMVERLELTRETRGFGVEEGVDERIRELIDEAATITRRQRVVARVTTAGYRTGAFVMILGMLAVIHATGASNLAALSGALLMLIRSLNYGQAAQTSYQNLNETLPNVESLVREQRRLRAAAAVSGSGLPPSGRVGCIEFDGVRFAYPDGEEVLHGVSFVIEHGDFVALVGPSGAGKSTVMKLLLRLHDPSDGVIRIDGTPSGEIGLPWWRERIAWVPQDPKLLAGTVADAIRFHRPGISQADIEWAARMAHVAADIEGWPDGYETQVGELGDSVSVGQRQRLAIARALARRPDVLLLDEPTSALDPDSEQLIAETFDELRGHMTIIVIAHRLQTVERANRVILVIDGAIEPHPVDDAGTLVDFLGPVPSPR